MKQRYSNDILMKRFFDTISPYWLWALLSLPAAGFLAAASGSDDPKIFEELLHPTGEFSARFMIIAMIATPLTLLFKGWRGPRWLVKNRRYFGVAAFGYALFHTVLYLVDAETMSRILAEAPKLEYWTGWLAFAIFIPLAVTSTDYFVRVMGPRWKQLQRWTYAAAVLTLVHWAVLQNWGGVGLALVHFGPLAVLEACRAYYWQSQRAARQRTI